MAFARARRLRRLASIAVVACIGGLVGGPTARAHTEQTWWEEQRHIEKRARSQIGAPYRYGGESPRGFDCSGLTRWVFYDHGAHLPHSSSEQFRLAHERDGYKRVWKKSRLKVGDLVFHKTTSARVGHAGIYIGNGKFISTTSSDGVRVSSMYDSYWGPRWVGATRVPATMKP